MFYLGLSLGKGGRWMCVSCTVIPTVCRSYARWNGEMMVAGMELT